MNPIDIIVIAIIVLVVGGAVAFMIKSKKSGKRCIGCPESGNCHASTNSSASCSGNCTGCSCDCRSKNDK